MSRVWYGSIDNRIEENRQFVEEIKVGDGVTEYMWSDRHPWEVIEVKDQKHITIRELDAKRVDGGGPSECQDYEYISNEENPVRELTKRGRFWYITATITKEELLAIEGHKDSDINRYLNEILFAAQFDRDTVMEKGKQTKYHRMNISIGKAERYYDYSF